VLAAKLEGRDPAAEKREAKRRIVADRVEDLRETFIAQRLSQNRSAGEISSAAKSSNHIIITPGLVLRNPLISGLPEISHTISPQVG
jgi:hypothetical protein